MAHGKMLALSSYQRHTDRSHSESRLSPSRTVAVTAGCTVWVWVRMGRSGRLAWPERVGCSSTPAPELQKTRAGFHSCVIREPHAGRTERRHSPVDDRWTVCCVRRRDTAQQVRAAPGPNPPGTAPVLAASGRRRRGCCWDLENVVVA